MYAAVPRITPSIVGVFAGLVSVGSWLTLEPLVVPAAIKLDVRRLQVPVDHPRLVGRLEPRRDLDRHRDRLIARHRPAIEPLRERLSLDILKDQKPLPVDLLDAVDPRDVGVIQ
jgi:hypothetical protein